MTRRVGVYSVMTRRVEVSLTGRAMTRRVVDSSTGREIIRRV